MHAWNASAGGVYRYDRKGRIRRLDVNACALLANNLDFGCCNHDILDISPACEIDLRGSSRYRIHGGLDASEAIPGHENAWTVALLLRCRVHKDGAGISRLSVLCLERNLR